jgi:hypothetical protein
VTGPPAPPTHPGPEAGTRQPVAPGRVMGNAAMGRTALFRPRTLLRRDAASVPLSAYSLQLAVENRRKRDGAPSRAAPPPPLEERRMVFPDVFHRPPDAHCFT